MDKDTSLYFYFDKQISVGVPIWGDIDNNGSKDILLMFAVESRTSPKYTALYYASFLKLNNDWIYGGLIPIGNRQSEFFLQIDSIKDGTLYGALADSVELNPRKFVTWQWKDNRFIRTSEEQAAAPNEQEK